MEDAPFLLTYGDGVSDIDINALVKSHRHAGKLATVTAVKPPGRFGRLKINSNSNVVGFNEKPDGDGSWINGGFFILEPEALKYVDDKNYSWESIPMNKLVMDNQLHAYKHNNFWHPLDTMRDKQHLNQLWESETHHGETGNENTRKILEE